MGCARKFARLLQKVRTESTFTCNLCESLCGLRVSLEDGAVKSIRGNPDDLLSRGHICAKAHALGELFHDPQRLRQPQLRVDGEFQPTTWEHALELTAQKIREIQQKHGKNAVALYVGNPVVHAHRSSLAAQLLTAVVGTQNRFDPNSQDSNPRLFACMEIYGDALAIPVPDVDRTQFLLMLGANPAMSQGSQMALGDAKTRLQAIVQRGGKLVVVDPRRTETAAWSQQHLAIRPGGDAALLLAMLQVIFAHKLWNPARVEQLATGVGQLQRLVAEFPPERVAARIGLEAQEIRELAQEFATTPRACAYLRVGASQTEFGPLANALTEILNVLTGNFNREGGALLPEPAADIAPLGRLVVGNVRGRWHSRVRKLPEFLGALPSAVMAEEMATPGPGQIRALICLAGNPVLSTPNGAQLEKLLPKLEFMAAIDLYANETTRHAHVILPPQHVFETGNFSLILQRFTVRNVVKYSPPILPPPPESLDDWQIATELAIRLKLPAMLHQPARKLAQKLPEMLVNLLLRLGPRRLTLEKLTLEPNGLDFGPLRVTALRQRANIFPQSLMDDVPRLEAWLEMPIPQQLQLIGRRNLRDNNSWMHNLKSVQKGPNRAKLLMHPHDAHARGLVDGQRVRVQSRAGQVHAELGVSAEMRAGVVSLPHGFGHAGMEKTLTLAAQMPGPNVNALTDELQVEAVLGTSILNGVPVEVGHG